MSFLPGSADLNEIVQQLLERMTSAEGRLDAQSAAITALGEWAISTILNFMNALIGDTFASGFESIPIIGDALANFMRTFTRSMFSFTTPKVSRYL